MRGIYPAIFHAWDAASRLCITPPPRCWRSGTPRNARIWRPDFIRLVTAAPKDPSKPSVVYAYWLYWGNCHGKTRIGISRGTLCAIVWDCGIKTAYCRFWKAIWRTPWNASRRSDRNCFRERTRTRKTASRKIWPRKSLMIWLSGRGTRGLRILSARRVKVCGMTCRARNAGGKSSQIF